MPPPVEDLSDDESGGDIPYSTKKEPTPPKNSKAETEDEDDDDEDDDDEDEDEEGVYVVEKITGHEFMKNGALHLLVKWKGYEKQEDMTWEPEDGLMDGAKDIVTAYYRAIGGRPLKPTPEPAKKAPGRKRKSIGEPKLTPAPTPPTDNKRRRKSAAKENNAKENNAETPALTEDNNSDEEGNWVPNFKNWDEELDTVDTIIRDAEGPGLSALLLWKNGKKSRVTLETCYEKCPKKMLKFYEKHLVFKDNES